MKLFAFFLLCLLLPSAEAQPTQYRPLFAATPGWSFDGQSSGFLTGITDAEVKGFGLKVSPFRGYLKAGVFGAAKVDMNGVGGTAVGLYGIAEGTGRPGGLQDEVVGVYGRADKLGPYWAAALHGECILEAVDGGGLCIGLNIELPRPNPRSGYIGVNIQPGTETRDVIGLQFQNPQTYRYSISAPNTFLHIGQVDNVAFCLKFAPERQALEFWRGCGRDDATRHGWVNMNWRSPDVQLNR